MKLRYVLIGYRRNAGLSLRSLAVEIGIDHTALHRFETKKEVSGANFAAIMRWLLKEIEEEE